MSKKLSPSLGEVEAYVSGLEREDSEAKIQLFKASVGDNASVGFDVVNVHSKKSGIEARLGVRTPELKIGDGYLKADMGSSGFGFTLGKKCGFSTPIGEASIDLEEFVDNNCVIQ